MLKILNFEDLKQSNLPESIKALVLHELRALLELSGGQIIDNEYGHVLVLEKPETDVNIEMVMGRPFEQLLFEGMAYRNECFVGYLAGDGNERLMVLICPELYLIPAWKAKLISEI